MPVKCVTRMAARIATCVVGAAAIVYGAAACGGSAGIVDTDGSPDIRWDTVPLTGSFELVQVDERPLPAPWLPGYLGSTIVAGSIGFDATFQFQMDFQFGEGAPSGASYSGTYVRSAEATLRLVVPCGAYNQDGCQSVASPAEMLGDTLIVHWGTFGRLFRYVR